MTSHTTSPRNRSKSSRTSPEPGSPNEVALTTGLTRALRGLLATRWLSNAGRRGAHQLRNIGCLADVAVCYPDLGRAGERELDSNAPRSASSPQDEGALARWVGNGTQRGQEALTVGVCP